MEWIAGAGGAESLQQRRRVLGVEADIRHQGGRTVEIARRSYAEVGVDARIEEFIDDMPGAYAWADLVICRAGAMTVAELAASGCAALFVPFPAAVDDHQTRNAAALVEAGAAELIQERDISEQRLAQVLGPLLRDRRKLAAMAVKARGFARPDALQRITSVCLELAA